MSVESEAKRAGRLVYIEPNNLFTHSTGNKVQNGIPQPYEDYSFSVNLRVINGDRYACGMTAEGDDIANQTIEFSSDKGTISFMDGTSVNGQQGYLTTNFTDISMNDPGTNTRECLGIESITIKYDSWYYPMVDIKFVDVRGASLMQPAEYEYYNNGGPNRGKNNATSNSDFFKSFFSFPYPLFKLSVKGFYGKEVTYDLSVLNCNIEFNSSTGNFEINASFIGYMYGMYGDLPFPFIYVAPYIDLYGKNTWDEKRRTGDFCYISTNNPTKTEREEGATQMYTFPELRDKVKNAGQTTQKFIEESEDGKELSDVEKLIQKLTGEVIPRFPSHTKNLSWWSWSKNKTGDTQEGYFFVSAQDSKNINRVIFEDFYKFSDSLSEYNSMAVNTVKHKDKYIGPKDVFENFYEEAKNFKKEKSVKNETSAETVSTSFSDDDVERILGNQVAVLKFTKEGEKEQQELTFDSTSSSFGGKTQSDYQELIDELFKRFTKRESSPILPDTKEKEWTIRAFKISDIKYKNSIINVSNDLKKRSNELYNSLEELRKEKIEEAIGFRPTMKNMYNMIFAHIDTFMSVFYNTLDRIRQSLQSSQDTSRKYENFGGLEVDVNENSLKIDPNNPNSGKLPPFTMFYKEETQKDSKDKKVVAVWPGSIEGGDKLEEVKLVESILNSAALNREILTPVSAMFNVLSKKGNLVPTNYYDLMNTTYNPYVDILKDKRQEDSNVLDEVLTVFLYRCYFSFLNGSYVANLDGESNDGQSTSTANYTKKAKLLAELEVENIKRAFEMLGTAPKDNFINLLLSKETSGSDIIDNALNKDSSKFISDAKGKGKNVRYKGIKKSNEYCLPVGVFDSASLSEYKNKNEVSSEIADKFLHIPENYTSVGKNSYSCSLYSGGKRIEDVLEKYSSGEFKKASCLFPSYKSSPASISGLSLEEKIYTKLPSYRKTKAGNTSIFMDPLYYSQDSTEARAYLFLMGIPYGKNKDYFLPGKVENGDYPTLLLLREGAVYWRNDYNPGTQTSAENDPIKYKYISNGTGDVIDALEDIEKNDKNFGRLRALETSGAKLPAVSEARRKLLKNYFIKWATGVAEQDDNVPAASLSFQDIERNLALWEKKEDSETKQLLSKESAFFTISSAYTDVNKFENSNTLKKVYEVSSDNKLGAANGIIRTGVLLRKKSDDTSIMEFLEMFWTFYDGKETIIDYSCFDKDVNGYYVQKSALNDSVSEFIKILKETYKVSSKQLKENTGSTSTGQAEDKFKEVDIFNDNDLKLACYISLKNMYDKWLCSRRRECWQFSCIPERMFNSGIYSDFSRFHYIDEFYHDIAMKVKPNLTESIEMICKLGGFTEKSNDENLASTPIMKVLSTVAQKAGCALLTLPTALGLAKTKTDENNSIVDVFKAFTYNDAVRSNSIETSFVVLYSDKKSSKLDIGNDTGKIAYKNDGFDIANTWGEIVPIAMFSDAEDDGYVVPSFGVTFAKQNQSYFKDIRLSMQDHQETEYSIKNTLMISYQNNQGPKETSIVGQDLYGVYSNYSYSCSVTMMGDAQISPLMYFQLNNIAMWKGAYLITNVQHTISSRGMETVFTGVRQSRESVPFKGDEMIYEAETSEKKIPHSDDESGEVVQPKEENVDEERPLDKIDVNNVKSVVFTLNRASFGEDREWLNGVLTAIIQYNDGTIENFKKVAVTLERTRGLKGKIENYTPQENEVYFSLPSGKFERMSVETPEPENEYRDKNDSFYSFTDGKHIVIMDSRLKGKSCEIVTGFTDYTDANTSGFEDFSYGGVAPIMIYGDSGPHVSGQIDEDEIRASYREIFNLVKRVVEAGKAISFSVIENPTINYDEILDDE